jgi:hypothetical protein
MMNNFLFSTAALSVLIGGLLIPSQIVLGLTYNERYASGYSHGCSDARAGGHPYLNSHPTHTEAFMGGYNDGYHVGKTTGCNGEGPPGKTQNPDNKFKVHVYVNWDEGQYGDRRMRVIVYGPHTLNKPTLDKPGTPLFLSDCVGYCYKDAGVWSFTGWKVPKGSDFKVCVWNQESGQDNCDWGRANSRSESIHVQAPW